MNSDLWTKIIMLIVALHFVAGFVYLILKLSPRKGDENMEVKNENQFEEEEKI